MRTISEKIQKETLSEIKNSLKNELEKYDFVQAAFFAGSAANLELLIDSSNNPNIVSDIEIGIVTDSLWQRKRIRQLERLLSKRHNLDIELFMATNRRLRFGLYANLSFREKWLTVSAYEISHYCNLIYQKKDWIFNSTHIPVQRLHPWEGVRLILNRFGESAPILIPWMVSVKKNDSVLLRRWITKLIISFGDCLLLTEGRFGPSYRSRFELWKDYGRAICTIDSQFSLIEVAYDARKS